MKKRILLIVILFCTAFAQAQEVFVTADFVSSYIWRGIDSGNASVQPSLGLNWKGLTVYAWGSTEFREKNNEIDLSLEYEYKNLTLYANNYFTQTEEEPFKYFNYSSHSTGHTFRIRTLRTTHVNGTGYQRGLHHFFIRISRNIERSSRDLYF